MKIIGKHEYELPVSVEFEIASVPTPEGVEAKQVSPTALQLQIRANNRKIKKYARTIKKDTKRLLRTLDKMKRHGWLVVDQTDNSKDGLRAEHVYTDETPHCWYCGKPILNKYDCIGHHIEPLTEANVNDPAIAYGKSNIMLVHHRCHNEIHKEREEERKQ